MEFFRKSQGPDGVYRQLADVFTQNLGLSLCEELQLLSAVEVKTRVIGEFASRLAETPDITVAQKKVCQVANEVFVDIVCSVYLAACTLERPAQLVLRRSLELGLALVYLWDMPHLFYAWTEHDVDLKFADMTEHISSLGYISLLKSVNPTFDHQDLQVLGQCKQLYRDLSNVVHGKPSTFESLVPNRFAFVSSEWRSHLTQANTVLTSLIQLWGHRFPEVADAVEAEIPSSTRT